MIELIYMRTVVCVMCHFFAVPWIRLRSVWSQTQSLLFEKEEKERKWFTERAWFWLVRERERERERERKREREEGREKEREQRKEIERKMKREE